MYFLNVIRVVLVFLLAIELRTVDGLADGRIVSLDANEDMATLLNERRRFFIRPFRKLMKPFRKPFRWLSNRTHKATRPLRKGVRAFSRIARLTVRNVRRAYRRTHSTKLRKCKKYCPLKSVRCGKAYAKCLGKCIAKCYAMSVVKHVYRRWRYRG